MLVGDLASGRCDGGLIYVCKKGMSNIQLDLTKRYPFLRIGPYSAVGVLASLTTCVSLAR
jgi:hypothetical protein